MLILVVEDTEASMEMLIQAVIHLGHSVRQANNGKEAIKIIQEEPVDIIISDILMPVMDGYELCKYLKANETYKDIYFVFYTATYTEESDKKLALSLGANEFYIKPTDPIKLLEDISIHYAQFKSGKLPTDVVSNKNTLDILHNKIVSKKLSKKISELAETNERIRDKDDQLRQITDALPELISELDDQLNYQYTNKAYEHWYNKPREEILGKHIRDVIGQTAFLKVEPYLIKALEGNEVDYETELTYLDGQTRNVWARHAPRKNKNGDVIGIFSLVADITTKKQAEREKLELQVQLRQAQKMEAIGQLTGGIAHDFNNILSGLLGYLELTEILVSNDLNGNQEKIQSYLKEVREAGNRAKNLVAQLLAFSRGTPGEKQNMDPAPIVNEIVTLLKPTIPATIKISTNFSEEPTCIYADSNMIHQIIMNLCINARDSIISHGQIDISIKHNSKTTGICNSCGQNINGDYISITVADTGKGIDKQTLDRIFEPFFTTKAINKGSGIGLAMVHGIVHELGGHISVTSKPDIRTEFNIMLPAASNESCNINNASSNDIPDLSNKPYHIMIVDDDKPIRSLMEEWLIQNNFRVSSFNDGQQALSALCDNNDIYDLLITDQVMPHLTGTELAKSVNVIHKNFPVIMCTGNPQRLQDEISLKQNIRTILHKPVQRQELINQVTKALVEKEKTQKAP